VFRSNFSLCRTGGLPARRQSTLHGGKQVVENQLAAAGLEMHSPQLSDNGVAIEAQPYFSERIGYAELLP
jgi:hypothetical protein